MAVCNEQSKSLTDDLQLLLNSPESNSTESLFCVINCENSTAWRPISFIDMFIEGLKKPGDVWIGCELASGDQLPEKILSFQGVVITGSRFNCRDRSELQWFDTLCTFIRNANNNGSPKLYGGCFGCQIIAFALGGVVDRNPMNNFILKAETIKCVRTCQSFEEDSSDKMEHSCHCSVVMGETLIMQRLCCQKGPRDLSIANEDDEKDTKTNRISFGEKKGLKLLVSRGDCVRSLPPGAKLLASSTTCEVEMYIAGSKHNIFACQSHPEFDFQYAIEERIWKSAVEKFNRLTPKEIDIARKSFEEYDGSDAKLFLSWLSDFLHSDL